MISKLYQSFLSKTNMAKSEGTTDKSEILKNFSPNEKLVMGQLSYWHLGASPYWPDFFVIQLITGIEEERLSSVINGLTAKGILQAGDKVIESYFRSRSSAPLQQPPLPEYKFEQNSKGGFFQINPDFIQYFLDTTGNIKFERKPQRICDHEFLSHVPAIPEFYDQFGPWILHFYEDKEGHYWARTVGEITMTQPLLVRIDDHCMTGFDLGHLAPPQYPELGCDCRQQSEIARAFIQKAGRGLVIHTPHEARGHGPLAKAVQLKLQGEAVRRGEVIPDTVQCFTETGFDPPDIRNYDGVRAIFEDLGLKEVPLVLLTNNPRKVEEMRKLGFVIKGRINVFDPNLGQYYKGASFQAKEEKLGHDVPPEINPETAIERWEESIKNE